MSNAELLLQAGQSIWYDNIQRGLLRNGKLASMITGGEVRGVTSNPTIFMNAIGSPDYDDTLLPLARAGANSEQIFWQLAVEDIQAAADLFRPLYEQSGRGDGYVSLEVNPRFAHDTAATLGDAERLWQRVDRPNLMIKIPATLEGLPAIAGATAAGINVNATLIFSRRRYARVMDAYLDGLERRAAQGLTLDAIASVASFFVSRVDTNVDSRILAVIRSRSAGPDPAFDSSGASALLGRAAVANARLAYADYKRVFASERFESLRAKGARPQRPLWASTGTKNPAYSDVLYVDELIGPGTVNTMPPQTLTAFLDHGRVRPTLESDLRGARATLAALKSLGISLREVTDQLEEEGVKAFSDAYAALLAAIEARRQAACA